jgi:hypothetical protein
LSVSISIYVQLPCVDFGFFRVQYLPEQEKAQIQDFRNWSQANPETSTRSAPDSPIMGLIKSSDDVAPQKVSTSGEAKE